METELFWGLARPDKNPLAAVDLVQCALQVQRTHSYYFSMSFLGIPLETFFHREECIYGCYLPSEYS